jgi:hypothetical protein
MLGLFSRLWRRGSQARRPVPSRLRPRYRPLVESLEGRAVPATVTVSIFGTPNPGIPGALVSFPVTIKGQLGPNDTDINGSATVVDTTTGVQLSSVPMVFAGGSPNSTVMYQFTASGTFAAGNHTIVATFKSNDPGTASSAGSVVEVIREPEVITMPPAQIGVISLSHHKHLVKETLKVCGKSKTPIQGPFFLAVENLNPAITLVNATGKTTTQTPLGTPFVKLTASSLSRKHCAKVTLIFEDPLPGKPSFTPVLLQTTGTP